MSRHSPLNEEVRKVTKELVPLFLKTGSVNALQRELVQTLQEDKTEGWIHPNRLHAILSENPSKTINTQTLDTIRLALSRIIIPNEISTEKIISLQNRIAGTLEKYRFQGITDDMLLFAKVSEEEQLPPAVVKWLFDGGKALVNTEINFAKLTNENKRRKPDWSFQNDAYEACINALKRNENSKTGLILPTGGGKTRTAIRIMLRMLADDPNQESIALWVTHRHWLKQQARRELQRVINQGTPDLPEDAVGLLAERVKIIQLVNLKKILDESHKNIALIVVDEAHHAAAPSYQPIFEYKSLRGLFLTATPNRTDLLPIGIDSVAYTITYRELFDKGVIIEPSIETEVFQDFNLESEETLRDFSDYLLNRAEDDFTKTLVVASRVDHVENIYKALTKELTARTIHILNHDDIGFVFGSGSSSGATPEEYLDEFSAKPRGILVATSQLLGEGFDDPSINSVVVTYPTNSIIQLMQVAGRCLRYAPDKDKAFIVQVAESDLAYHYEQRWLYQDISDYLHPQLQDRSYSNKTDLKEQVEDIIYNYRVNAGAAESIRKSLERIQPGENFNLLLTGLPYYGAPSDFYNKSLWSAVPITTENRDVFVNIFNSFSALGAKTSDYRDFLANYVSINIAEGSEWQYYMAMLHAMDFARQELNGEQYFGSESRDYKPSLGTSWLTYITFSHRVSIPLDLANFLQDAVNKDSISIDFTLRPNHWAIAAKIPLPVGNSWVYLLDKEQAEWIDEQCQKINTKLQGCTPLESFGEIIKWRFEQRSIPIPQLLVENFNLFITPEFYESYVLQLNIEV